MTQDQLNEFTASKVRAITMSTRRLKNYFLLDDSDDFNSVVDAINNTATEGKLTVVFHVYLNDNKTKKKYKDIMNTLTDVGFRVSMKDLKSANNLHQILVNWS